MGNNFPSRNARRNRTSGAFTLQLLVVLVPLMFALMGFAIDLGRLWIVRTELNQAANAMAIAAAAQLAGASGSASNNMLAAAQLALNQTNGNRYSFGSRSITFDPNQMACFGSATAAAANDQSAVSDCGGGSATAVQVAITAPAPLIFWSFMPGGSSRTTDVASYAVAGVSAPLCTACGIEPYAVAAVDSGDTVNFGFGDPAAGSIYTFSFSCTGTAPSVLAGATAGLLPYVLINRFDSAASLDEPHQIFRDAAGGLAASTSPNPTGSSVPLACAAINDGAESIWASAAPGACTAATPLTVINAQCGLDSRFEDPTSRDPASCGSFADLAPSFAADTDPGGGTDAYSSYQGSGRRIITVAVVDTLATGATSTMTVLGFRQFLVEPNPDLTAFVTPADTNGRFNAMYIGNPKPVAQGWFDDRFGMACPVGGFSGPGKVVLFQ